MTPSSGRTTGGNSIPSSAKSLPEGGRLVLPARRHLETTGSRGDARTDPGERARMVFTKGETARMIADFMAANDGIITLEDLALYEAKEREPIRGTYRGYEIVSMPPPSSGGTVLVQMLNILEGFDLREIGHNSALYLHLLTESMRRAYADRANHLGDPGLQRGPADRTPDVKIPCGDATSARSSCTRSRRAIQRKLRCRSTRVLKRRISPSSTRTAIWCRLPIRSRHGYGSKIVVDGAGFLLNNEMGDFNAQPRPHR